MYFLTLAVTYGLSVAINLRHLASRSSLAGGRNLIMHASYKTDKANNYFPISTCALVSVKFDWLCLLLSPQNAQMKLTTDAKEKIPNAKFY